MEAWRPSALAALEMNSQELRLKRVASPLWRLMTDLQLGLWMKSG